MIMMLVIFQIPDKRLDDHPPLMDSSTHENQDDRPCTDMTSDDGSDEEGKRALRTTA